ncbi:hypothetical protein Nepgr_013200 [Nepenthes gracilis]|uniref:HMA domain-containing protein n=1 Tax=Nepenthes gracilis TaxID=150966 RepID=A0AAD3SIN9_NEPGR|nr:hypothetical protein Nepgr_013200 [Nepenthes gracilis]
MEAPAEVEGPSIPLKYKKWVLKVSIHCEGCKKKVKKILHSIEGVYAVDVDSKLHQVTVIGDIDSETLIKKLEKTGKHAELWPERSDQGEKKSSKSKKKERQEDSHSRGEGGKNAEKQKVEVTSEGTSTAKNNGEATAGNNSKTAEVSKSGNGSVNIKGVKVDGKKPETTSAGESTTIPDKKVSEGNDGAGKTEIGTGGAGGGGGGEKKKKQAQKGNDGNSGNEVELPASGNGPAGTESPNRGQCSAPSPRSVNLSHPGNQHVCECPPSYSGPPPVSAVCYNTVHPTSSPTASFYAAQPPYSYSYAYAHPGTDLEHPPPSSWSSPSLQPSDTFELFSDENPNACSIM